MSELPISAIAVLIKRLGGERVSRKATTALADILEAEALKLGREATALAGHAGRKTVSAEDVRLSAKTLRGQH